MKKKVEMGVVKHWI